MASLILSDGTVFTGQSFGAETDTDGEVVFNTGMVGYPESMTDPSYRGQILVFTYPLIGNYGVPSEERNQWGFSKNYESEAIHVRAIIVAQESREYSHHTAVSSLHEWMKHHGIPGISGIDTRALTKKLREHGVMLGKIVQEKKTKETEESKESKETKKTDAIEDFSSPLKAQSSKLIAIHDPNLDNLVAEVSIKEPVTYDPELKEGETVRATIVAYDCGIKRNILRSWLKRGVRIHRVPWNYDLSKSKLSYDGVFLSNGPGDPKQCTATIASVKWAVEQGIPTFGICLGNQLLALAVGGDTYKLKYGHRGANQPCVEEAKESEETNETKDSLLIAHSSKLKARQRCIITSQNHGFAVDEKTLPAGWHVWWRNANDGTVEGIRHESGKYFSVQFHPEATPGPEDAGYLFDEFLEVISK